MLDTSSHPDVAPEIASVAGVIGDRARAAMLVSLMDGRSLTATELARAAQVTKQTASSHLSKLVDAHLVVVENVGRHRYCRLAGHDVGAAIESLVGLAQRTGVKPVAVGPADPALRHARVCYDHLAGDLGVLVFDSMLARRFLRSGGAGAGSELTLTGEGERFIEGQGIDVAAVRQRSGRRPLCRGCLDWSARRPHLAGSLGSALLDRFTELGWAKRRRGSRVVTFTPAGERALLRTWANSAKLSR